MLYESIIAQKASKTTIVLFVMQVKCKALRCKRMGHSRSMIYCILTDGSYGCLRFFCLSLLETGQLLLYRHENGMLSDFF